MKYDAGQLDLPIEIKSPNYEIISGEKIATSYSLFLKTWAARKVTPKKESEDVEAMARTSSDYTNFRIRQPPSVLMPTSLMILIESDGQQYDIENIKPEGRNQYIILVCKQRQQR